VRTDAAASVTTGGLLIRDFGSTRKAVQVTTISDLSMRNCVLQRLAVLSTGSSPSISNQTWADNMHYIDTHSTGSGSPGTHVTTGGTLASLFRNPLKDDFTPAPDSPLRGRERPYTVPADVFGLPWQAVDAIGAAGAGTAKREAVPPAEEKERPNEK
jgi:hypothetical protein